jgi:hypothetical protein
MVTELRATEMRLLRVVVALMPLRAAELYLLRAVGAVIAEA